MQSCIVTGSGWLCALSSFASRSACSTPILPLEVPARLPVAAGTVPGTGERADVPSGKSELSRIGL